MINKQNLINEKAGISYLEILILIISIFAFSYLVYDTSKELEIVSAQEYHYNQTLTEETIHEEGISWNCCSEDKDGNICQDFPSNICQNNCNVSCLPTKCEQVSSCKLGCCYDEDEGLCTPRSPKQRCENNEGVLENNPACNILKCRLGCCVLGGNVDFITSKRCEILSAFYGYDVDFRPELDIEIECLILAEVQTNGACVIESGEERACKFISRQECLQLTGNALNFHENLLCSNPDLETNCKKTNEKTCSVNEKKVHFLDSCDNLDEVYEKCNYPEAKCVSGICKDMNCKNTPYVVDALGKVLKTKYRKNGESWCVYDSYIGKGKDVVGSRHWKYSCLDGEVRIEPCQDYRQEICVESELEVENKKISNAACAINRWRECLDYNNLAKKQGDEINYNQVIKKCRENSECYVKELDFGEGYHLYQCLPQYPTGFELDSNRSGDLAKRICGLANFECVKIEVKKLSGWECVVGCECDSQSYTQQMNDWCISLGDCGGYVNIIGKTSRGYRIDGAPAINLNKYKKFNLPIEGQKAEPGDVSGIFGEIYGGKYEEGMEEAIGLEKRIDLITKGASGVATVALMFAAEKQIIASMGLSETGQFGGGAVYRTVHTLFGSEKLASLTPVLKALGNFLSGAAAGAIAGKFVAQMFGLSGDAAIVVVIGGAAGGGIGGFVGGSAKLAGKLGFFGTATQAIATAIADAVSGALAGIGIGSKAAGGIGKALGAAGAGLVIGLIVAIVLAIIMKLLGIGDTKETHVYFKCYPWQAPSGGQNCEECNVKEKECSEYRCGSLGQACELINEGTGNELCTWINKNDAIAPKISPWEELISQGYKYVLNNEGFSLKEDDDECIETYKPLIFGIITDEVSQCKYDVENVGYEEMTNYFGENNLYKKEHSILFNVPHPQILANEFNLTYEYVLDKIGDMRFYVKCQDANGNVNVKPYLINICIKSGPDKTAPIIWGAVPPTESYVKYGITEQETVLYINEPAECKWDIENKVYDNMRNSMSCKTGLREASIYGWTCLDTLPLTSSNFYFRCKDQPWLAGTVNETNRNVNAESFVYELKKSASKLSITKIEPEKGKEIKSGVEPFSVTLKAYTSGGAESGEAECSFRFGEDGTWIQFYDTFSSKHEQVFDYMLKGTHIIYVKCEDVAGNEAEGETNFKLKIDTSTPKIIRAYNAGQLEIITNEDAECVYTNTGCNFIWSNATKMSGIMKEHTAPWESGRTYYIKCRDLWDNKPSGCSIIIKAV